MNKKRLEGEFDQIKGDVKTKVGKATNNPDLEAEGTWDKVKGAVKEGAGKIQEAVRKPE
jgi:uncharacterized protein YjbJ (UPF0337 family)